LPLRDPVYVAADRDDVCCRRVGRDRVAGGAGARDREPRHDQREASVGGDRQLDLMVDSSRAAPLDRQHDWRRRGVRGEQPKLVDHRRGRAGGVERRASGARRGRGDLDRASLRAAGEKLLCECRHFSPEDS